MDTTLLIGMAPKPAGKLSASDQAVLRQNSAAVEELLTQNSAAVEELLTRTENGSDSPSPIECRCFERTDAKASAQ